MQFTRWYDGLCGIGSKCGLLAASLQVVSIDAMTPAFKKYMKVRVRVRFRVMVTESFSP